jgi:hypothetical protein
MQVGGFGYLTKILFRNPPTPLAKQWNPPTGTMLKLEEEEEEEDQLVSEGVLEPYEHKCAVRTRHELEQIPTL